MATKELNIYKHYFSKGAVLGRPPIFSETTDPSKRIFSKCLAHNAPIVTIIPRRPNFARLEEADEDLKRALTKIATADQYDIGTESARLQSFMDNLSSSTRDKRYFSFTPAPKEYLSSVNALLSRVHSRMSEGFQVIKNPIDITGWGGLNIYMDKSSSISESASNEYGESFLESVANKVSDVSREAGMIIDKIFGTSYANGTEMQAQEAVKQQEMAREKGINSVYGGFFSGVGALTSGNRLLLPKIWKSSEFSKSYSLSFKFQSPYGDRNSVFTDVITPYMCLLALGLPKQTHTMGYEEPFLVRMDSPGWFSIECGVVTNMTVKRSPSENDWTKDGLSRVIEVTMDVMDIYPALMLSFSHVSLDSNFGLSQYLDSIAGLDYTRVGDRGTASQVLNEAINRGVMGVSSTVDELGARASAALDSTSRIFNAGSLF